MFTLLGNERRCVLENLKTSSLPVSSVTSVTSLTTLTSCSKTPANCVTNALRIGDEFRGKRGINSFQQRSGALLKILQEHVAWMKQTLVEMAAGHQEWL